MRQLGSSLGPGSTVGQKRKQQGQIRKILAWEGGNPFPSPDYLLARFVGNFFFAHTPIFFSFFPNAEPGPRRLGSNPLHGHFLLSVTVKQNTETSLSLALTLLTC